MFEVAPGSGHTANVVGLVAGFDPLDQATSRSADIRFIALSLGPHELRVTGVRRTRASARSVGPGR